jgi:NADPH2:quinone reductase
MRAVICSRLDGPAALSIGDMPRPALSPGQVRIAVKAAGLNFADTLIVKGLYQVKPPLPFTPGLECAGVVAEIAPGVTGVKQGDRVMATVPYGAFAEEVACDARALFPMPDALDFVTAAGFPVVYGSAHMGLDRRGALKPGETLLVLGAAGGLGLAAVELGKAMGATVIGAARDAARLEKVRAHGADHVIDYEAEDLRTRVKAITQDRGVDVAFDPVGGDIFDAALRCLGWEGRIVVAGFAAGRIPQIPANLLLVKNIAAIGVYWGAYRERDPAALRASFATLARWLAEGRLKPHVSLTFPLEQAPEAMEALLSRATTGKIVLTV